MRVQCVCVCAVYFPIVRYMHAQLYESILYLITFECHPGEKPHAHTNQSTRVAIMDTRRTLCSKSVCTPPAARGGGGGSGRVYIILLV